MKNWWRIRQEVKKLKKAGMLNNFTKEQLKCIATLHIHQIDYIITDGKEAKNSISGMGS